MDIHRLLAMPKEPRQEHRRGWEMPGEVREVALPEVGVARVVLVLRIRRQTDRRLQQVQVVDVAVEEEPGVGHRDQGVGHRQPGAGRTFPQVVAAEEEQPQVGHREPGVGRSSGPSCRPCPCPSVVAAAVVVAGNYSSPACRRGREARPGHR